MKPAWHARFEALLHVGNPVAVEIVFNTFIRRIGSSTRRVGSVPMDESPRAPTSGPLDRGQFDREWTEILNEIRVALPGVQLLFGFLLAAPFTDTFRRMSDLLRYGYFVCFLTTTASSAFLIAPSVYHRLHWRRNVVDKEQMLRTANTLAIVGGILLAFAMTSAVYIISVAITGRGPAIVITFLAGLLFAVLWFALPLLRRNAEQKQR